MGWTNPQAVALFRTSCEVLDVSAFLSHPTAPHLAAFYLAIARSAVCASPLVRGSSINCDHRKFRTNRRERDSGLVRYGRVGDSLRSMRRVVVGRPRSLVAKSSEPKAEERRGLCLLFADRTQEDD